MKVQETNVSATLLKTKEELNVNHLVSMYYGTFDKSDEPIFNPKAVFQNLIGSRKGAKIPDIGK